MGKDCCRGNELFSVKGLCPSVVWSSKGGGGGVENSPRLVDWRNPALYHTTGLCNPRPTGL